VAHARTNRALIFDILARSVRRPPLTQMTGSNPLS